MATRGFLRMVGWAALGSGTGLAVSGCNLGEGFADFGNDLTNQEMVVIDGPGRKIADGQTTGLLVDPWGDRGAVVVGFRDIGDGPKLRMQPFDGSAACEVARAYRCIVFNRLPNEPQLIAYLDNVTDRGRGTLYFADHSCKIAYGGIEDAELPQRLFDSPPGFIVPAANKLLEVDPFRKRTRTLTENLRFWSGPGTVGSPMPVWFVGDGQFVVLDAARNEALRIGRDVTEVVFQATEPNQGLFLVDGGSLTHYEQTTGTAPKVIANDACNASLGSYGVSYFSPCGERKLIVRELSTGTEFEVDSSVSSLLFANLRAPSDGSFGLGVEAVFTKPSEAGADSGGNGEDLWLKQLGQPPRLWQHRLGRFLTATAGPGPTLVAVVDSDGDSGRMVRDGAEGEQTLCEHVSLRYPIESLPGGGWLLLTDVVEGYGTLVSISQAGERQVVAEHIAVNSSIIAPVPDNTGILDGVKHSEYYNLRAFLTNAVDGTGNVTLMDRTNVGALLPLDSRVPDRKFNFFRNMSAISYLDQFDPTTGTGTLSVYQTHVGVKSVVAKNVSDYSELVWPHQGVIYTVKEGNSYSLWESRAKP